MTREEAWRRTKGYLFDALSGEEADKIIKTLEQEPCEDAISRQAVLDYIDKMPSELTADGRRMIRRRTLEEYISDTLSSVKQEPKWILTSERLPNVGQWVLVTTKDYQKYVEVMCYQGIRIGQHDVGNGWEEYEYPSWTSGYGDIQGHHPKAWMPLPSLYKGE